MTKGDNVPSGQSFIRVLLLDVMEGIEAQTPQDGSQQRRDLIRRIFAAVEGLTCIYRDHVRGIAKDLDLLTPEMEMAFDGLTYTVDEQGNIKKRVTNISTTSMLRLITRLAAEVSPEFSFDFGDQSWVNFKTAIKIRNRITHPSNVSDLDISDDDIYLAKSSILWIVERVEDTMATTNRAYAAYTDEISEILTLFRSGDQETVALFAKTMLSNQH